MHDSVSGGGRLAFWVVAGLLVRIALTPITLHGDLLFIHYFPFFLSHQGVWDIYGYFGPHYLDRGFTYYAPMVYFVTGCFQWILRPFESGFPALMEQFHAAFYAGKDFHPMDIAGNLSGGELYYQLARMKAPFLALEAASAWLIYKTLEKYPNAASVLPAWALNPVLIFSTAVMGQFRALTVFWTVLTLFLLSRDRRMAAAASLACLALTETYPALLIPFFILCVGRTWRERVRLSAWMGLIVGAVLTPFLIHSGGYALHSFYSPLIQKVAMGGVFLSAPAWISPAMKVFFGISFLWLLKCCRSRSLREPAIDVWVHCSLSLILLLYATTSMALHYFMWAVPLLLFTQTKREPWPQPLTRLLYALLFLFCLDTRALNLMLFAPVHAPLAALPSLHEWMDRWIPWGKVVGSARLGFSVLCAGLAWRLQRP